MFMQIVTQSISSQQGGRGYNTIFKKKSKTKLHFYTYTYVGMIANKLQTVTTTRWKTLKKKTTL